MKNTHTNKLKAMQFALLITLMALIPKVNFSQALPMSDFVVFGGNGTNGPCTNPSSPGYGVIVGASSTINGGSLGTYTLFKTNASATLNSNIHSGGKVELSNNVTVTGKISAANTTNSTSTILTAGTNTIVGGNIDVKGNIVIGSGTISGQVTRPAGKTYSGPAPAGGHVIGTPTLPTLPSLPAVTSFPSYGNSNVSTTTTINPGSYKSLNLSGGKNITFNGPGVYVFKNISNSGSGNKFIFNFQNSATGTIKIYVHGDVSLGKNNVDFINGGDASRLFLETHGSGSSSSNGTYAFNIANGTISGRNSEWFGTVYAPYAAINFGANTGLSNLSGALWSGTQVNIQCGVAITYVPFNTVTCTTPNANAGTNKVLDCNNSTVVLNGSSSTPNVNFLWAASNGGSISSNGNTATPTVSAVGTYTLTVTTQTGGCTATSSVIVTSNTTSPDVNAGPDIATDCAIPEGSLSGSSTTANAQFAWTTYGNGFIVSGAGSSSPVVNTG
ncbi:MAG: hypothetical protein KBD57_00590, partial [Bacteroidia bacterium]|nr:hypothetical protein [Bacteroidia bacterium]